jgi:hypothetical protein
MERQVLKVFKGFKVCRDSKENLDPLGLRVFRDFKE